MINLGDLHWATQRVAPVILTELCLFVSSRFGLEVQSVEGLVLNVKECRPAKSVSSALDIKIGNSGLPAIVLRPHCAGLEFELANCLRRRAELVVVASRKAGPADGNAFDQNLVGVLLAAINGTLKCATRRPGQAAEDEALDLPLAVIDDDRPALVFLDRDVAPYFGRARIEQRRLFADRHL